MQSNSHTLLPTLWDDWWQFNWTEPVDCRHNSVPDVPFHFAALWIRSKSQVFCNIVIESYSNLLNPTVFVHLHGLLHGWQPPTQSQLSRVIGCHPLRVPSHPAQLHLRQAKGDFQGHWREVPHLGKTSQIHREFQAVIRLKFDRNARSTLVRIKTCW